MVLYTVFVTTCEDEDCEVVMGLLLKLLEAAEDDLELELGECVDTEVRVSGHTVVDAGTTEVMVLAGQLVTEGGQL